ncbi:MAG: hypothetical protein P8I27_01340 [Pirellulaceae bacterium]|nr:hypothetical protein [Pirellulaceae bacterium]
MGFQFEIASCDVLVGLSEAKFFVKLVELIGFSYILYVVNLNNRFVFTNDDALLAAMDEGMPPVLEMVGEVEDEFVIIDFFNSALPPQANSSSVSRPSSMFCSYGLAIASGPINSMSPMQ